MRRRAITVALALIAWTSFALDGGRLQAPDAGLQRGGLLLKVRDTRGAPIQGASVLLAPVRDSIPGFDDPGFGARQLELESSEDGEARAPALEPHWYQVQVMALGRVPASLRLEVGAEREERTVLLTRAAAVQLVVTGAGEATEATCRQGLAQELLAQDETGALWRPGSRDDLGWRFSGLEPGEVTLRLRTREGGVWESTLTLREGDAALAKVNLSAAVEIEVAPGLLGRGGQLRLGCGPFSAVVPIVKGRARAAHVLANSACTARLLEAPLAASVTLTAPGKARLVATSNEVVFLTPLAGDAALTVSTQGASIELKSPLRLVGLPSGHYRAEGHVGATPVRAEFDVTVKGNQPVALAPVPVKCFTAKVEGGPAEVVGYERLGKRFRRLSPLAVDGDRRCFERSRVEKLAVVARGSKPAVFDLSREELGTVTLGFGGSRLAASIALESNESGAFLIRSRLGPLDFAAIGLRSGDELLAIDGESMEGLVPDEVSARLESARPQARLAVRGAEGVREVILQP